MTGPVTLGPPRLVVVVPLTDGPAASRKTTNPIRNCTRSSPVRAVDGVQSACVSCEGGGERSGAVPAGSRSPQTASCQEVFFPRQQRRLLGRQDTWRELGLLEPGTVRAPGACPRGQGGGSGEVADCLNSAASPWRDWFYFVFLMPESLCIAPWGGTRIGRGGGGVLLLRTRGRGSECLREPLGSGSGEVSMAGVKWRYRTGRMTGLADGPLPAMRILYPFIRG